MLLQISKSFTNYLLKKEIIEYSKKELIIYGSQLTLSTFASIVTILTLSCFFNILYGSIFLLFFMPIRFYAGGYHAQTYRQCYIYTNTCFLGTLAFSNIIFKYSLLHGYIWLALVYYFFSLLHHAKTKRIL